MEGGDERRDLRLVALLDDCAAYDRAIWALTPHRSLAPAKTRERLAFLGDSVGP